MLIMWNKVYTVLSENVACRNLRVSRVRKIILKSHLCKVCDKLHVWVKVSVIEGYWIFLSVIECKWVLLSVSECLLLSVSVGKCLRVQVSISECLWSIGAIINTLPRGHVVSRIQDLLSNVGTFELFTKWRTLQVW